MKQIYFSMFHSILSYGIIVWGGCGITSNLRMSKVQEGALSILNNLSPNTKLPPLFDNVYKYSILMQLHKYIFQSGFSEYFHTKILSLQPNHEHQTRFNLNHNLIPPVVRKTITQKQFFCNAISEWNNLPQNLREISDGKKFKYETKKLLLPK